MIRENEWMSSYLPYLIGNNFLYRPLHTKAGRTRIAIPPKTKRGRKCLLSGCEVLTTHNGGYCCASHKKEDDHGKRET